MARSRPFHRFAGSVPSGAVPISGIDVGDFGGGFRGALADLAVYPRVLAAPALARLATADLRTCRTVARLR